MIKRQKKNDHFDFIKKGGTKEKITEKYPVSFWYEMLENTLLFQKDNIN